MVSINKSIAMHRFSALDIVAGILMALFLIGPLSAGMLASRYASDETKAKSQAPVNPAEEQRK